ncbi:MAG: hypothetical protein L6R39_007655 [Caloplaca ligustica]|nr:MAG: hypothetical protein L6R39_007655 [Caloplaca ligustica]
MSAFAGFLKRNYEAFFPTEVPKSDPIRIGLLGASKIAPIAVISAAKTHPEVLIVAVAARDKKRATAYAKKYRIPIVHDSYQALLDDPAIDAIYNPLPNGHHYEWTVKALKAGKHVLLEKPSVSNAAEARSLFRSPLVSGPDSPVLLEAFHYRFHPAWKKLLSLIEPDKIIEAHASMVAPKGLISLQDIRCKFDLAGGCLMDVGTYTVSCLRQLFGTEPEECLEATYRPMPPGYDKEIDQAFAGKWTFPNGAVGSIHADMIADGGYFTSLLDGFPSLALPKAEVKHREMVVKDDLPTNQEHAVQKTVIMWNWVVPTVYHRIDIEEKHTIREKPNGKVIRSWAEASYVKEYGQKGAESWLTYRHQLEEFVNKIRKRPTGSWVDHEDSIRQMEMIDGGYKKAGLLIRPSVAKGVTYIGQ